MLKLALCAITVLSVLPFAVQAQDQPESSREYAIKAAFIYKFILFTDWPKEKFPDGNEPLILAVIGEDPFGNAFESLKNELVKGRSVIIKRLKGTEEPRKSDEAYMNQIAQTVAGSHVLFICPSETKIVKDILKMASDRSILTIADMPGFVESGGIIGLSVEDAKVRFEINNTAANEARLKIGSQLLRLAKRVIQDDSPKDGGG